MCLCVLCIGRVGCRNAPSASSPNRQTGERALFKPTITIIMTTRQEMSNGDTIYRSFRSFRLINGQVGHWCWWILLVWALVGSSWRRSVLRLGRLHQFALVCQSKVHLQRRTHPTSLPTKRRVARAPSRCYRPAARFSCSIYRPTTASTRLANYNFIVQVQALKLDGCHNCLCRPRA